MYSTQETIKPYQAKEEKLQYYLLEEPVWSLTVFLYKPFRDSEEPGAGVDDRVTEPFQLTTIPLLNKAAEDFLSNYSLNDEDA